MTDRAVPTGAAMTPCGECGMLCAPREYHPYAACLMFKACHNSETVRANLEAVRGSPVVAGEVSIAVESEREGLRTAIRSAIQAARYHFSDPIRRDVADRVLLDLLDDINARPTQAQAGAVPLTHLDTKRLAWMADGWTPGHEALYVQHVLNTGGTGSLEDLRTFIDQQIVREAAHGIKGADHA